MIGWWYAVIVPLCVVVPITRTYVKWSGLAISAFEICVMISALCLLPFTYAVAAALLFSITVAAWFAFAVWDGLNPARDTLDTHTSFPIDEEGSMKEPVVERAVGFFALDLPAVHYYNSSKFTVQVGSMQSLDAPEAMLQIITYTPLLIWMAFYIVYAPYTVNVVALCLMVVTLWYRIILHFMTQCVYVADSVIHICLLLFLPIGMTFSSVVVATYVFSDPTDVAMYCVIATLPFALCFFSQPTANEVHNSDGLCGLKFLHGIHLANMYLYPWWFYRATTESAWWSLQLLWALCGSPADPGALDAGATRIVFSLLALFCAMILVFDAFTYQIPRVVEKLRTT